MKNPLEVAIVILNFNGKKHLQTFLPSVVENSSDYRIIVADNGSSDDSVSFLRENFPAVEVLENPENLGFAGGYNWALANVTAEFYILLNSDVEVTSNWVEPLIALLKSDETIAACQPKILSYVDKTLFEHAGAAGGFIDHYGYPFCRGRIFNVFETDRGQYDDTSELFWATGACLAIKAEDHHAVGGFDADFFAHMEEIDLCWRLKLTGKKIFYTAESTVYHLGGGTLATTSPQKTFLNFRNNLFMLQKNLPAGKLFPVIFIRMILDGVAAVKLLTEGNAPAFAAVFRAHLAFYASFRRNRRKRKNNGVVSMIYQKSIVYQFFVNKLRTFTKLKF